MKNIRLLLILTFINIFIVKTCFTQDQYLSRFKYFSFNNSKDFLFTSTQLTGVDFWATPVQRFETQIYEGFSFKIPQKRNIISLFRYSKEIRLDLIQYDDLISFSLNSPFGASLNTMEEADESFSISSIIAIQLPIIAQFNFFRNSSKIPIDKYGFNFGFGYQYFYLPFSFTQKNITRSDYIKSHGQKIIRFGFINSGRNNIMWGLDLRIGLDLKIYKYNRTFDFEDVCWTKYYYSIAYVLNIK